MQKNRRTEWKHHWPIVSRTDDVRGVSVSACHGEAGDGGTVAKEHRLRMNLQHGRRLLCWCILGKSLDTF